MPHNSIFPEEYPIFTRKISICNLLYSIKVLSRANIYNDILLPSLSHAKISKSIPDECSQQVVLQLGKSHAHQLSLKVPITVENFEFITSL